MRYTNIIPAKFIDRPNRFTAHAELDGRVETVHVKNTGRGTGVLIPGAEIFLTKPGTPGRKTRYDLVAARKDNGALVNIDSQAPNKAAAEWLAARNFDLIVPEYRYGNSRIDFYMERGSERFLMEIKGCTLEIAGTGYFPDAPTERGIKHLHELADAARAGYHATLAFVIQIEGVSEVRPNLAIQPEFGAAWDMAKAAGVQFLMLPCHVEPDRLEICADEENFI